MVIKAVSVTVDGEPPRLRMALDPEVETPRVTKPVPRAPLVPDAGLASRML